MSIGMIFLLVLTLLILFGVLQRVLDRMALTDRQALILVAAIFIGGWLPDLRIGMVSAVRLCRSAYASTCFFTQVRQRSACGHWLLQF